MARSGDFESLKHSSDHNQHSLGKVDIYSFKCMSSFIYLKHVGIVLGLETAACAKQVIGAQNETKIYLDRHSYVGIRGPYLTRTSSPISSGHICN